MLNMFGSMVAANRQPMLIGVDLASGPDMYVKLAAEQQAQCDEAFGFSDNACNLGIKIDVHNRTITFGSVRYSFDFFEFFGSVRYSFDFFEFFDADAYFKFVQKIDGTVVIERTVDADARIKELEARVADLLEQNDDLQTQNIEMGKRLAVEPAVLVPATRSYRKPCGNAQGGDTMTLAFANDGAKVTMPAKWECLVDFVKSNLAKRDAKVVVYNAPGGSFEVAVEGHGMFGSLDKFPEL